MQVSMCLPKQFCFICVCMCACVHIHCTKRSRAKSISTIIPRQAAALCLCSVTCWFSYNYNSHPHPSQHCCGVHRTCSFPGSAPLHKETIRESTQELSTRVRDTGWNSAAQTQKIIRVYCQLFLPCPGFKHVMATDTQQATELNIRKHLLFLLNRFDLWEKKKIIFKSA